MDDKMRLYLAALTIYENNMRILHWKLRGPDFHTTHERFGDYYEELGKYMDEAAEQIISMGDDPVNSSDAMEIVRQSDLNGFVLKADADYPDDSAENAAYNMMEQLYKLSSELAGDDSLPIDVSDVFMGHAKYFRIEGMYKLARRIKK